MPRVSAATVFDEMGWPDDVRTPYALIDAWLRDTPPDQLALKRREAEVLFRHQSPAPLQSVDVLAQGREALERANRVWKERLASYEQPFMDPAVREELDAFVARRKAEGGVPTDF